MLLVDRATLPSDTISVHDIHQPGVARLEWWGCSTRSKPRTVPRFRTQRFDVGPFRAGRTPPPANQSTDAYTPRRTILDKILVDAAVGWRLSSATTYTKERLVRGTLTHGARHADDWSPSVERCGRIRASV